MSVLMLLLFWLRLYSLAFLFPSLFFENVHRVQNLSVFMLKKRNKE